MNSSSNRSSDEQKLRINSFFRNLGMVWLLNAMIPYVGVGVMSASGSGLCLPPLVMCWILEAKYPHSFPWLSMYFFYSIVGTIIVAIRYMNDLSRAESALGKRSAHQPDSSIEPGASYPAAASPDSSFDSSAPYSSANQTLLPDANAPFARVNLGQIHSDAQEPTPLRASLHHSESSSHIHFGDSSSALPTLEAKLRRAEREMSQNANRDSWPDDAPSDNLEVEPSRVDSSAQLSSPAPHSTLSFQPVSENVAEVSNLKSLGDDQIGLGPGTESGAATDCGGNGAIEAKPVSPEPVVAATQLPSEFSLLDRKIFDSNQAIVDGAESQAFQQVNAANIDAVEADADSSTAAFAQGNVDSAAGLLNADVSSIGLSAESLNAASLNAESLNAANLNRADSSKAELSSSSSVTASRSSGSAPAESAHVFGQSAGASSVGVDHGLGIDHAELGSLPTVGSSGGLGELPGQYGSLPETPGFTAYVVPGFDMSTIAGFGGSSSTTAPAGSGSATKCPKCGAEQEGQFSFCMKCLTPL